LTLPDSAPKSTEIALVKVHQADAATLDPNVISILAVGSDARPGENFIHTRGDALQLVTINTETHAASIIGVPRDSWVDIPGHGHDKINASLYYGGPDLLGQTVGNLIGVHPKYVFVTRFQWFSAMVRSIGGIDIHNPYAFSDDPLKRVGFNAGRIHLNGYDAMAYARIRHTLPAGDFDRSAHQEIVLRGIGGHAARPHSGNETLVAACALVTALQTIVSRRLSPTDIGVVSVTELITDGTRNALPGLARILGDARSFRPEVSAEIEKQMRTIAHGTAQAYNVSAEVTYTREFVPLVNDAAMVDEAFAAARNVLAGDAVGVAAEPMTGSEDFARFLDHVPGCFVFLGNGNSAPLHNPSYDFNDEGLLHGARFHAAIARQRLPGA